MIVEADVAGVCPVIRYIDDPSIFFASTESTWKRLTNKFTGQIGLGYETVEKYETHREAIDSYFQEEVIVSKGEIYIPDDLEKALLCVVQLSKGAWLFAYDVKSSRDIELRVGKEKEEIGGVCKISYNKVKEAQKGSERFWFRAGTLEIMDSAIAFDSNPKAFRPNLYLNSSSTIPDKFFNLMETGKFNQTEALSRSGIQLPPLEDILIVNRLQLQPRVLVSRP